MNNKFKRLLSILMALTIISGIFSITIYAQAETDDYLVRYTGSTESWSYRPNCTFTVYDIFGDRFRGNFSAANLGQYSFSQNIEGTTYIGDGVFTCVFTVNFYNGMYYSNMCITVYPYEGYCCCICEGSWHMENFTMHGTRFLPPVDAGTVLSQNYDEDDIHIVLLYHTRLILPIHLL